MTIDETTGRQPDWFIPSSYAYTRILTRDPWAWEFLRRNPLYCAVWQRCRLGASMPPPAIGNCVIPTAEPETCVWGLPLFFADPNGSFWDFNVFWQPERYSSRLPEQAEPVARAMA